MSTVVLAATTLKSLALDDALAFVDEGAALVDLRDIEAYLDVHVHGSLDLVYESGPGMAARARDCVPLDIPLVIEDLDSLGEGALRNAAASLRGKGFTVLGSVKDAINQWASARSSPASVDVVWSPEAPPGPILDVGDPGARVEGEAIRIPIEKLWRRLDELRSFERVVIAAGYGVRAALAVGLLERFGTPDIVFWRSARVRRRALTG